MKYVIKFKLSVGGSSSSGQVPGGVFYDYAEAQSELDWLNDNAEKGMAYWIEEEREPWEKKQNSSTGTRGR